MHKTLDISVAGAELVTSLRQPQPNTTPDARQGVAGFFHAIVAAWGTAEQQTTPWEPPFGDGIWTNHENPNGEQVSQSMRGDERQ